MGSLQAYSELKQFVSDTNKKVLDGQIITHEEPSYLVLGGVKNSSLEKMETFTDDYIRRQLKKHEDCTFLVFTNLASMQIKGEEYTYILYKCYHKLLEQGLVFYQFVDKETLEPSGELQFSNQEDNIFFHVEGPKFDESSCNAIEAKESTPENKKIVFLIGNMSEERLLFDIQRLIITTVHNCLQHNKLKFDFIISMARYGSDFTESYEAQLIPLKKAAYNLLEDFSNVSFDFQYAD